MLVHRSQYLAGLTALVAIVAACGKNNGTGPLAPYEPQITNLTDDFALQASNVQNVTWTYNYRWRITGDTATVNQATTLTGGSATLTIFDNNNQQLLTQSLSGNGTFGVPRGVTGTWTIRLQFTNYTGSLNFRVQKQ